MYSIELSQKCSDKRPLALLLETRQRIQGKLLRRQGVPQASWIWTVFAPSSSAENAMTSNLFSNLQETPARSKLSRGPC